jgi:hypothetical protein
VIYKAEATGIRQKEVQGHYGIELNDTSIHFLAGDRLIVSQAGECMCMNISGNLVPVRELSVFFETAL